MHNRILAFFMGIILLFAFWTSTAIAEPESTLPAENSSVPEETNAGETAQTIPVYQPLSPDSITAPCAILVDTASGKVLFSKNAETKCYPASITKIMTCVLALQKGNLDDQVKVSNIVNTIEAGSSICGLRPGETLTLEQLLYGLMLNSGNDAAAVIAEHIGGSIEGFADMMNEYAAEIGMTNSHFVNPHGLHSDQHYTTPEDMAKIARVGMSIPKFREIVSTRISKLPETAVVTEERVLVNGNKMLDPNSPYYYENCIGIKTGYTTTAKHTLVASAARDGVEVIAVVMKDEKEGKWHGMKTMFEYAFKYYGTMSLNELYESAPLSFVPENADTAGPDKGEVFLQLKPDDGAITTITDTKENIAKWQNDPSTFILETDQELSSIKAPIAQGQEVTRYTYFCDEIPISSGILVAANAVDKNKPESVPKNNNHSLFQEDNGGLSWISYVLIAFALLLIVIIILRIRRARRYRRMHRRRRVVYRRKRR